MLERDNSNRDSNTSGDLEGVSQPHSDPSVERKDISSRDEDAKVPRLSPENLKEPESFEIPDEDIDDGGVLCF